MKSCEAAVQLDKDEDGQAADKIKKCQEISQPFVTLTWEGCLQICYQMQLRNDLEL